MFELIGEFAEDPPEPQRSRNYGNFLDKLSLCTLKNRFPLKMSDTDLDNETLVALAGGMENLRTSENPQTQELQINEASIKHLLWSFRRILSHCQRQI